MPYPVLIRMKDNGRELAGPFYGFGQGGLWEGLEFGHEVSGFMSDNGWELQWQRFHRSLRVVIELGSFLPQVYSALSCGRSLESMELLWPRYLEKTNSEEIFFRTIVYPVKIERVRLIMPCTKNPAFERYSHLVEICAQYRWIEWEYCQGKLWHRDEWHRYLVNSFVARSEIEEREIEHVLNGPAVTDDLGESETLRVALRSPSFEHTDEDRKKRHPDAVQEGDSLILSALGEGLSENESVYFDIFDISGGRPMCVASVQGRFGSDVASGEWIVDLSKARGSEPKLEFEACARGIKTCRCELRLLPPRLIIIPWCFDCHMHHNSGHCAPLPLSVDKLPGILQPFMNQKIVDGLGKLVLGEFGQMNCRPTDEIGDIAVKVSAQALKSQKLEYMGDPANRRRLLINMPMDMDYAHYRGYEGRQVYETVEGKLRSWNEKKGRYDRVSLADHEAWENYREQIRRTANTFYKSNGQVLSFYHYDPRANLIDWRAPFDRNLIQTADPKSFPPNLPAIGIKMYTALGYKPLDPMLQRDPKRSFPWHDFYGTCEANRIPITCHCSRGGMTTHDMLLYYDREFPNQKGVSDEYKKRWFGDNFISPFAWERVLEAHPKLHLCLAHFGGEEFWDRKSNPECEYYWNDLHSTDKANWIAGYLSLMQRFDNFYVDLSYFLLEDSMVDYFKKALQHDPKVKERVLFGTDWWMFAKDKGFRKNSYSKYMETISERFLSFGDREFMKSIGLESSRHLLANITVLNPLRFLRLKEIVPLLADAHSRHPEVRRTESAFEPASWIESIPSHIEDFPVEE